MNELEQLKEKFKIIGLTEAEAKIFVYLLHNTATASEISRILNMNRTFVYEKLNSLLSKGFISEIRVEGKHKFRSVDPEKILESLKQEINKKEKNINETLEIVKKIKLKPEEETFAELFFGKRSIFYLLNTLIKEKPKTIYVYGTLTLFKDIMDYYFENFNKKRIKQKIKIKALVDKYIPLKYSEIEILEQEQKTISFFYNNKSIIIILTTQPFALLIKNKELVNTNINVINKTFEEEVKIYKTKEGIEHAYFKLIEKENDTLDNLGYFGESYKKIYSDEFAELWQKECKKRGIKILTICNEEEPPPDIMKKRVKKFGVAKLRSLPKIINGPTAIVISSNYIMQIIYAVKEPRVLFIKNKEAVKIYREHFQKLWKMAKPIKLE